MTPAPIARYRRILGEGGWVIAGQALVVAGGLAGTRLLTQVVPPRAFGVVSLVIGAAVLIKNFTFTPLAQAGTRFYPDLALVSGTGLLRRVLVRGLRWTWGAAALAAAAGLVWGLATHRSPWWGVFVAAMLLLDVLRNLEATFLGAARRQRALSLWNSAEAWLRPGLAIAAAALLGPTTNSVLIGYIVSGTLALAIFWLAGSPEGRNLPADSAGEWTEEKLVAELRAYSIPLVPLAVILWANSVGDRYILNWLRSPLEVGIYAASYGLVNTPFIMSQGVLTQTLRPVYLHAVAEKNRDKARRTYALWLGGTASVCAVGLAGVFFLKDILARWFLASEYRSGAALMPWVAAGAAIYATGQVVASYLLARKRTTAWVVSEAAGAATSIPVTILLVQSHGAMGAAMACPIYCGVIFVAQALFAAREALRPA